MNKLHYPTTERFTEPIIRFCLSEPRSNLLLRQSKSGRTKAPLASTEARSPDFAVNDASLIRCQVHRVASKRGRIIFSPPYLLPREKYIAILSIFAELGFEVLEFQRNDLLMTMADGGIERVVHSMQQSIRSFYLEDTRMPTIDVGASLGSGLSALAWSALTDDNSDLHCGPNGRVILSPVPDPVAPWDSGAFASSFPEGFTAGLGNYETLKQIGSANQTMVQKQAFVIAERTRSLNPLELIQRWALEIPAFFTTCTFVHGTFRNKGLLPSNLRVALNACLG